MWGLVTTYIAPTVLARPNKNVAARERNGKTSGVSSAKARKERYWNGSATRAAVPTVASMVTVVGLSKLKFSPITPPARIPYRTRIKLNI